MTDIVRAQLSGRQEKLPALLKTRISLEVLKHLVRTEYELHVIGERSYLRIAATLVETSKMANGWIKYLTQNSAR